MLEIPMITALEVDYRGDDAVVAGVTFRDWMTDVVIAESCTTVHHVAPYESGSVFKRGLPCLLRYIESNKVNFEFLLIDGYVWLGDVGEKGLGAHLYSALGGRTPVIGVAKTRFLRDLSAVAVTRGKSLNPL